MFQLARLFILPLLLIGCQQTSVPATANNEKTGNLSWAHNCKTEPLKLAYTLLSLEDFGPPSQSSDFTGVHWYEWNASGSSDPNEKYDIHIVVYAAGAEGMAKQEFKDDKRVYLERDFRFRNLQDTQSYVNTKIEELTEFASDESEPMKPMFEAMIDDLNTLKNRLSEDVCETY